MRRRASMSSALASVVLAIALTSCTSMATRPVPGPTTSGTTATTTGPTTSGTTATTATTGTAMALDRFWGLVAGTYAHDPDAQAAALEPRLRELSVDDLTGFQRRYVQLANALATPAHYAAAQVVMGYVSQDAFVDLRTWVVFQGRASYEAFLADPDAMAGWGPTDDEQLGAAETLQSLPDDTTVVTPPWADDVTTVHVDPDGTPQHLTYAQLRQRFPRLAAVYLPSDLTATDPWAEGPRPVHRYA